ncbi:MAG: Flp pilus assembly complex ATPase component TadA [Betaproteobacteria bacterium]|jgi:type IV secretion system protein VirB11|nr:Flp pilus assembly complex ATPase component TadA [Betaproteobacteria bacterium]
MSGSPTAYSDASLTLRRWMETRFDNWLVNDPAITELAINDTRNSYVMSDGFWRATDVAFSYDELRAFAQLVSTFASKPLTAESPTLSAYLPRGERVELAIPPQAAKDTVLLNIRKHSVRTFQFESFVEQGYFTNTVHEMSSRVSAADRTRLLPFLSRVDRECWEYACASKWPQFLQTAVREKRNAVISGATGTGKTAFMNSLFSFIPETERLGISQDVDELRPSHPNVIYRYFKTSGAKSGASVEDTMMAFMRSTVSRLIQSELRGAEAFFYLQSVLNSGHPGGITSIHANSAVDAFLRLALLVKASPAARDMPLPEIRMILMQLIHVVVQLEYVAGVGRNVPSIYYDPFAVLLAAE